MAQRPKVMYQANSKSDIMYTPDYGIEPIYDYTKKYMQIWEPCCGPGNIVNYFKSRGKNIIGTEKEIGYEPFGNVLYKNYKYKYPSDYSKLTWTNIINGLNFLTTPPPGGTDCIITNPPYSIKDAIIERCFEIGLPFALLMPDEAIAGQGRSNMWKDERLEQIVPDSRIDFIEGKSIQFHVTWFCVGMDIRSITGRDINHYILNKPGRKKSKGKQLKMNLFN